MTVTVSTPSRLHFGLLRFEQAAGPSFGGLGMMINEPRWTIELQATTEWSFDGVGSERVTGLAPRLWQSLAPATAPALRVTIHEAIPPHHGFGGGTQLALALAAGMRRFLNLDPANAEMLASITGRGKRSAVGTHGFLHGGLIWETGRLPGETLGRLASRVSIPAPWRVVLVQPASKVGLSGKTEHDAFANLPPVPTTSTGRLTSLAEGRLLPAAKHAVFEDFSDALYDFGRLAGECFAPVQGGAYASREIADCVQTIRGLGVRGVGQSSWGPTVYAFVKDEDHADWLAARLSDDSDGQLQKIQITAPDNNGATLSCCD